MKKILIFMVILMSAILVSCDFFRSTTTQLTTVESNIQSTDSSISPTTEFTSTLQTSNPDTTIFTTVINDETYILLNPGQDTVDINEEWIDAGAVLVINDVEFTMETEDMIDTSILGIHLIKYSYNYNNQSYEIVRYVYVADQTSPEIKLNLGVDTIKVGEIWIDAGVIITDNSNEIIIASLEGTIDNNLPGVYVITYIAIDSSGNTSSIIRYVTVIE